MAAATVEVVINGHDNASGAIDSVISRLGQLQSASAGAVSGVENVNSAVADTGQSSRSAAGGLNETNTAMGRTAAQSRDAAGGINETNAAMRRTAAQSRDTAGGVTTVRGALRNVGTTLTNAGNGLRDIGQGIDSITRPVQIAGAAYAAAGIMAGRAAIDFEDNFANVKKTVEGTPQQLESVRQGLIALGTTGIDGRNALPATTQELTELAAAGGQLGIKTENIVEFTETMAQMAASTNLSGEEGAKAVARFMNVANVSQNEVKNLGSAIVDLGNNFATSESEIINMAQAMGSTGAQVGISAQDVLAYSTALSSMGIEAEAGGSSLQRIWMDMQNAVSAGGDDLEAFAKISGKSSEDFAKQWKEDASGAFRDFLQGLNESSDQVGVLSELGFSNVRDQKALMALAGEKGFDILTEAIQRSNAAWAENTALQNEFDAKAETTASQIQVARNNITEAARSFGEALLPTVKRATEGVKNFAQEVASMDDAQKSAVVSTAATVVTVAAVARGTSAAVSGIGTFARGLGAIATAAGTTALPVLGITAGVVALGAAVTAGVVAYNRNRYAQTHWADGAEEAAQRVQSAIEKSQGITALQREMWDLKQTVNDPNSTSEQLEAAKSRIQEIAGLLEQEYDLKINVDAGDLDGAVEKVSGFLDQISGQNDAELGLTASNLRMELAQGAGKFATHETTMKQLQSEWDTATEGATKYGNALAGAESVYSEYIAKERQYREETGRFDFQDTTEGAELAQKSIEATKKALDDVGDERTINNLADAAMALDNMRSTRQSYLDQQSDATNSMSEETAAYEKMLQAREKLAEVGIEQAQRGDTAAGILNMKTAIDQYGMSVDTVAQNWALAQNGFDSFSEAVQSGDLSNLANDVVKNMTALGESADKAALQGALVANGFRDITSAAGSGALDAVATDFAKLTSGMGFGSEQINDMAHSLGLLPESKHIEISVDGNTQVVDDAAQAVEKLNSSGNVSLEINAQGNYDVLDTADAKLKALAESGAVTIKFNVETQGFDINDLQGNKIGEITAEGKINWVNGDTPDPPKVEDQNPKIEWENTEEGEEPEAEDKNPKITWEITTNGEGEEPEAEDKNPKITWEITTNGEEPEAEDQTATVNYDVGNVETPKETTAEGTVNYDVGDVETPEETTVEGVIMYMGNFDGTGDAPPKDGVATYSGDFGGVGDAPPKDGVAAYSGDFSGIGDPPQLHGTVVYTAVYEKQATGTQNFGGGLAMVNDQKGVSDPRELIIDNGHAFIPEGKDVILPLSKGAKVYTAAQTKAIMSGLGIPHFASGNNNNSVAFGYETDDWTHYTKTHAVTVTEELEKWQDLLENAAEWDKDIADCEEQIYAAQVKVNEEANEASAKWIAARSALYDWDEYGDSPMAAFARYKERNLAEFEAGRLTWAEYSEDIEDFGEDLLDARIEQSEEWLEHEKKYNGLSTADYIEGLKRMQAYTLEYYQQGIINQEKFNKQSTELNEKYLDAVADYNEEIYSSWEKSKDNWIKIHNTYDDWDEIGDSLSQAYARAVVRQDEFYKAGVISWQDAEDAKLEYSLQMYEAASDEYDDMLAKQSDYISELQEKFSNEEEALRSSWDVEDRSTDLDEVNRSLEIYKNAVTDAGKQKYKDLLDQKKQLERDEELYQLQTKNNATIEKLKAEYDEMEANKKNALRSLKLYSSDVSVSSADIAATSKSTLETANAIGISYTEAASSTISTLSGIYSLLSSIQKTLGNRSTNTYNDSRTITLNSGVSEKFITNWYNRVVSSSLG